MGKSAYVVVSSGGDYRIRIVCVFSNKRAAETHAKKAREWHATWIKSNGSSPIGRWPKIKNPYDKQYVSYEGSERSGFDSDQEWWVITAPFGA